jgi:uncharacterized protein (TIGR02996 family)
MPVFFADRSFDLGPTGKYLKRFEDDTVLGWFQRHWEHLAINDRDQADERLTEVLGCDGWFLWNPFRLAAEEGLPPPQTAEELLDLLRQCLGDGDFVLSPHCLQVLTEEDGEGGALSYFDDHFLKQSGGLASYLLHEGWQLPPGHAAGPFVPAVQTIALEPPDTGPGATFLAFLTRESKYPLDNLMGAYRIDGVRLPELARHVCHQPPDTDSDNRWPSYLRSLPALLLAGVTSADPMEAAFLEAIRAAPGDAATWAAWSDWRQERSGELPGLGLLRGTFERLARLPGSLQRKLPRDADLDTACRQLLEVEARHRDELRATIHSLIHVEAHLAQMCLDVSRTEKHYFHQWILFDDLWASAHPDLANAILRFAARWDVLSAC